MGIFVLTMSFILAFASGHYNGKSVRYPPQLDEDLAMEQDVTPKVYTLSSIVLGVLAVIIFIGGLFMFSKGI